MAAFFVAKRAAFKLKRFSAWYAETEKAAKNLADKAAVLDKKLAKDNAEAEMMRRS